MTTRLDALASSLRETLGPLLPEDGRHALLEFPHYPNAGDSAIWLGERACLAALGAPAPVYVADIRTYRPAALRARLGGGTILLQGGGSFGDLWPDLQAFRESVIRDFPDHAIVQLPQTIHFESSRNLERTRAILGRHPSLTLLVRDRRSLELARRFFDVPTHLCPDMAFHLRLPARRRRPRFPVLWLGRTDSERAEIVARAGALDTFPRRDWPEDAHTFAWRLHRRRVRRLRRLDRPGDRQIGALERSFDRLAWRRVRRAEAVLDQGRVVITDRLHGHIFCLLRGQPHVLLDNSYGKLRTFHEAWTRDWAHVRWATTSSEAAAEARALAREAPPGKTGVAG